MSLSHARFELNITGDGDVSVSIGNAKWEFRSPGVLQVTIELNSPKTTLVDIKEEPLDDSDLHMYLNSTTGENNVADSALDREPFDNLPNNPMLEHVNGVNMPTLPAPEAATVIPPTVYPVLVTVSPSVTVPVLDLPTMPSPAASNVPMTVEVDSATTGMPSDTSFSDLYSDFVTSLDQHRDVMSEHPYGRMPNALRVHMQECLQDAGDFSSHRLIPEGYDFYELLVRTHLGNDRRAHVGPALMCTSLNANYVLGPPCLSTRLGVTSVLAAPSGGSSD